MAYNQQNLSPGTAYVRFFLGSVMTAYGTVRLLREPKSRSGKMLVLLGSMNVAEGATKFCPRKAMSTIMEKMMSENTTQIAQATNASTSMNSETQHGQNASGSSAGQMNGNIMKMVGNIAQKLTGGNSVQSTSGSPSTGGDGTGQNAMSTNTQTVAPQVSQIVKNLTGMTGSQDVSGTSGSSNKKDASTNSENTKSASSTTSNNKQSTTTKGSHQEKSDTKTRLDGAANNSNIDPSVISKSGQNNTPTPNIIQ